jgi:putative membrane protein
LDRINKDLILREKLALQRTVMANQTTLLSFIRTSLYFLVAGLSLKTLLKLENSLVFQFTFYAVSLATAIVGLYN